MSDAIRRLEWLSPEHIKPILDFIDRQAELAAKGELQMRPITEEESAFLQSLKYGFIEPAKRGGCGTIRRETNQPESLWLVTEEESAFVRELLKQRRDAEDPEHRYGFRRNEAIQPQFNDEKLK